MSSRTLPPTEGLFPINPTRPVAGYIGGKRNLAKRLVERINAIPHDTYAEVFVGMGGVFFRRTARPKAEVINDWSKDVATLFRVLQRLYVPFMDILRWQLTTRSRFEELLRTDPTTLLDIERAARFLYLQKTAFGGKVVGRQFGVDPRGAARFDVNKLGPMLEAVHERLSSVVIERLQWADFVRRYDRPGTLFYLDPPYYGCERDYGDDSSQPLFERDYFEQMAQLLASIEGRFVLSINAHDEVRRIFSHFAIEEVETTYSVGGGSKAKKVSEFVITGR